MKRITRSIKGEMVDFDLLKIKQQLVSEAQTPSIEVTARKDFIDKRLRRKTKKALNKVSEKIKEQENISKTLELVKEVVPETITEPENFDDTNENVEPVVVTEEQIIKQKTKKE